MNGWVGSRTRGPIYSRVIHSSGCTVWLAEAWEPKCFLCHQTTIWYTKKTWWPRHPSSNVRPQTIFSDIHPSKSESFQTSSMMSVHHLLHFFHSSRILPLLQPQQEKAPNNSACKLFPSLTEFTRSGVKFKKKKKTYFLDMMFEMGWLEVSPSTPAPSFTTS